MGAIAAPGLTDWRVALRLGRVSNLPTVWTNVLAGMVVAGGPVNSLRYVAVALAMSLLYVGGMYLNDAFDREIDALERPTRPIPSGAVSVRTVFLAGFGLLALGFILLALYGMPAALAGLLLIAAIIGYDWWHKANPLSPVVMGLCRGLVYLGSGLAVVAAPSWPMLAAAVAVTAYIIGLTYIARQENLAALENLWPALFLLWPFVWLSGPALSSIATASLYLAFALWVAWAVLILHRRARGAVPKAVVRLIAGVSLLDAVVIAAQGAPELAILAVLGWLATLTLQRWIAGT